MGKRVEVLVPERQRSSHDQLRAEFQVEIRLSPIRAGDAMIVLTAIRDVSDRKRIEEDLRRVSEERELRRSRELRDSTDATSGHSRFFAGRHHREDPRRHHYAVEKPFTRAALLKTIDEVLR